MNNYLAICCIVKNEIDLNEWIEYHLNIGVDKIFIFDNNSDIPIKSNNPKVEVNIYKDYYKQMQCYADFIRNFTFDKIYYKWVAFIDCDEFIVCNNDLKSFLNQYENYGAIAINWQMFGSSWHKIRQNNILSNYLFKATSDNPVNKHVKCVVNMQYVIAKPYWNPHNFFYKDSKRAINSKFDIVSDAFSNEVCIDDIQLNHYYLKSWEDWLMKVERGRADLNEKRTEKEFFELEKEYNLIYDSKIFTKTLEIK